jgi:hypothetical protein
VTAGDPRLIMNSLRSLSLNFSHRFTWTVRRLTGAIAATASHVHGNGGSIREKLCIFHLIMR